MGRTAKIHDQITFKDPQTGQEEAVSLPDALCRYLEAGSYLENAAEALGIGKSTLYSWLARGKRAAQIEGEVPESEEVYLQFLEAVERARARGIVWHEANVRRHAELDGRLSLEFLARRQPRQYSKRIEVDTDPGDREALPLDAATVAEIEEAFDAAHVPAGIEPARLLPQLPAGEPEEAA